MFLFFISNLFVTAYPVLLAGLLIFYLFLRKEIIKLETSNQELLSANSDLVQVNEKLQSSDEQLQTNLDYINELQQYLAQKERQYREMIENSTDMIYELDETGKFFYANPLLQAVSGYEAVELKAKHYWELVHPGHREHVVLFYKRQLKDKKEVTYLEFPILNRDGHKIWIGQNVRMFFNEEGWVGKVNVVARDISQLKNVQKQLEESEKLYRLLSENSQDMITLFNPDNSVQYISGACENLIGYKAEELLGKEWVKFVHPEDLEKITLDPLRQASSGNGIKNLLFRFKKKSGEYIWIEAHINPVMDEAGNIIGFQASNRDITQRKEAEEALIIAKEKAEEATKAKSLFLSMMSHEIRTPMNAIIGLTNMLLQEHPRPDQLESIKLLKFSGENLLTIINDILDFSKIEAGKIDLEYIDFDLYTLLFNSIQMLEPRAGEKNLELHFKYAPELPHIIKGDQVRIGQIVTNLVSNAIKFTEKGFVELSVTNAGKKESRHEFRFTVRDTGIGIEEEKIQQVFESFTQARSDTTRKFGGTGLGLSISKRLLNLMDSEIEVQSSPGKGSEFSFTLTLEEGNKELVISKSEANQTEELSKLSAKVLLVDDNRVNQIVASNFLKKWGIEADFADNGGQALDMIQNKSYQIILMDLLMPEMDGYEASQKIRSLDDPYFKEIPIIALTASAMNEIREKALASGMNDFVSKPFQPQELRNKINEYLTLNINVSDSNKELSGNLDLYAEGDPEFRRELASLTIKNIEELKQSLEKTIRENNAEVYKNTMHKVKTMVAMLGDTQFAHLIHTLAEKLSDPASSKKEVKLLVNQFNIFSKQIVSGLTEEIMSF